MSAKSIVMVTVYWILTTGYTLLLCWLPKRLTQGKEIEVSFGWRFQAGLIAIELISLIVCEINNTDPFWFVLTSLAVSVIGSIFFRYWLAETKRDATFWRTAWMAQAERRLKLEQDLKRAVAVAERFSATAEVNELCEGPFDTKEQVYALLKALDKLG
jgi:hypothetical protein